jgi:phage gpG-like protein
MMKRIGIGLIKEIDVTFKSEGKTRAGKPWKALSAATLAMRRRGKGKGNPRILQDTGRYKGSFSPQHRDSRWKVSNNLVRVGSNVEYGPRHEFGEGVPERKVLPTRKRTLSIAVRIADGYIDEKIRLAGLK